MRQARAPRARARIVLLSERELHVRLCAHGRRPPSSPLARSFGRRAARSPRSSAAYPSLPPPPSVYLAPHRRCPLARSFARLSRVRRTRRSFTRSASTTLSLRSGPTAASPRLRLSWASPIREWAVTLDQSAGRRSVDSASLRADDPLFLRAGCVIVIARVCTRRAAPGDEQI